MWHQKKNTNKKKVVPPNKKKYKKKIRRIKSTCMNICWRQNSNYQVMVCVTLKTKIQIKKRLYLQEQKYIKEKNIVNSKVRKLQSTYMNICWRPNLYHQLMICVTSKWKIQMEKRAYLQKQKRRENKLS